MVIYLCQGKIDIT